MLTELSIKNYALIDSLKVGFGDGFHVITGETGAGKSILLGALSLVLGKRADLDSLKNKSEKCVIEAEFSIVRYDLKHLFKTLDLDYEEITIIRREILPGGKSRAFINDTPCTLDVLQSLSTRLIDIHSQHQTLQLTDDDFQLQVIDAVAGNKNILADYHKILKSYSQAKSKLQELIDLQKESDKEQDYNSFLLEELRQFPLEVGMQEELEATYEKLSNVEEIQEKLSYAVQILSDEQLGTLGQLSELKITLQKLSGFGKAFEELGNRVTSVFIELDDAFSELQGLQDSLETDPKQLEATATQLRHLYDLQKKHQVADVDALIAVRTSLEQKVAVIENLEEDIKTAQLLVLDLEKKLDTLARSLHENRSNAIPKLKKYLEKSLQELGMEHARFDITLELSGVYGKNGKDRLSFLFAANKGSDFGNLKKVASGGELSRIMLSIKALLAKHMQLPTIMFDEIDTGVSGEISHKMGDIMRQMSSYLQVFSITHLPQVAAKGDRHYKVYKQHTSQNSITSIKLLNEEERIIEIAGMLGGKELSNSAMAHARQLLN
ncbi:DNA repair protein RecN [Ascidiimonas aurantiaca]|uniref:DNA repair protein RecN n=1 Tax=Ascidiimonas aurantiaca TaxID=1685432 RepID=UPI0030EF526A